MAGRQVNSTTVDLIQAAIAKRREEIASLEMAASLIGSTNGHAPAERVAKARTVTARKPRQMRLKPADDSLERDVVDVLVKARKPLKGGEVCGLIPGTDDGQVIRALRSLAKRGAVIKSGATHSLRYSAPQFATV